MAKILRNEELLKRAKKLGVNTEGEIIYQSKIGRAPQANESELQRHIIEAEKHIREARL